MLNRDLANCNLPILHIHFSWKSRRHHALLPHHCIISTLNWRLSLIYHRFKNCLPLVAIHELYSKLFLLRYCGLFQGHSLFLECKQMLNHNGTTFYFPRRYFLLSWKLHSDHGDWQEHYIWLSFMKRLSPTHYSKNYQLLTPILKLSSKNILLSLHYLFQGHSLFQDSK